MCLCKWYLSVKAQVLADLSVWMVFLFCCCCCCCLPNDNSRSKRKGKGFLWKGDGALHIYLCLKIGVNHEGHLNKFLLLLFWWGGGGDK